jgi:hypothetical protein
VTATLGVTGVSGAAVTCLVLSPSTVLDVGEMEQGSPSATPEVSACVTTSDTGAVAMSTGGR